MASFRQWMFRFGLAGFVCFGTVQPAVADSISLVGLITQSTLDGTGPAVNNPTLNDIRDGDRYSVTLTFAGNITGPGSFAMTAATFLDSAAPATETAFGSITLTISSVAGFDDFSLLACLTTGSGCNVGNQLDANFQIPAAMINGQNVAATGLDQPHPLDLLEDDGVTDIQGSITSYSYVGPISTVPEPMSVALLGSIVAGLWVARRKAF
jgi:hypothetical protein